MAPVSTADYASVTPVSAADYASKSADTAGACASVATAVLMCLARLPSGSATLTDVTCASHAAIAPARLQC